MDKKTKTKKAVPAEPAIVRADPMASVKAAYTDYGWTIIEHRGINDIIAHRGERLHFIQVITAETANDVRFQQESRNIFIQNAFSNQAEPIYAHVVITLGRDRVERATVTFQNVNTNARVIIGNKKRPPTKNILRD